MADPVREPFAAPNQQREAAMMGMYIFLASETMLFSGLFLVALYLRLEYAADVVAASRQMHYFLGAANTALLLTSSFFVALAVEAAREGRARPAALMTAILLGFGFLGLKAVEYRMEVVEGILPLPGAATEFSSRAQHAFMNLYLIATALHALHLAIGVGLLATLAVRLLRGTLPLPERSIVLMNAGLYWHLVDVIWIFLYPVFYLAR
ncbi:cytochrome c oxidase subunit 3 [Shinella sp.]|uniref:cytochrome c oxidase subunit 3 n=1 Tax=Shinella sp. TaxID=1870904 RepID=UPI00301C07A8